MGTRVQTAAEIRENLAEQLDWRFAERDDARVAQALHQGEVVDAVHTLDEAGLLDGFFAFLQETQVLDHWQTVTIAAVQRVFLPVIYFILLYGTRVLFGIESTNALPSLLFSNVAVMTLIGFNAWQVAQGLTQRGVALRTEASEYTLMDPQTLAGTICKAHAAELEHLFNGTIQRLAASGVFPALVLSVVDGTLVETTAQFQGCGCLAVTKRQRDRQGVWFEYVELVYGWRLIALIDALTLIPVAIKIVPIQNQEAPYLVDLVRQAQINLAPHSQIQWLVADRAYVDGPSLYELDQMGIIFTVIAKSNMVARTTALALCAQADIHERVETVRHGYGHDRWFEEWVTRVQAVEGIRTWANYRPPKVPGERLALPDRPVLNAVVVSLWRNQTPSKDGPRVYLTNGPVDNPWPTVDGYDDRSWIENGLFRNSKQFWRLTRWFPKKTAAGVRSHLTFVVLMVATATAYRLWDQAQAGAPAPPPDHQIESVIQRRVAVDTGEIITAPVPVDPAPTHLASALTAQSRAEVTTPNTTEQAPDGLAHNLLGGQGARRWRRQLQRENRDKVIVFMEPYYGIFDMHVFLVLTGIPVRQSPPHLDSRAEILHRYGCDTNAATNERVPDT
ncbi:MAG: transposase [Chloroflexi bacterium]|nr:transposase [Chloroflexota bacterium]